MVRGAEILLSEDLGDRTRGNPLDIQQDNIVEVRWNRLKIMVDGDNGVSGVAHVMQELDDCPLGYGVDPNERLVHQIELGLLSEGTGQKHSLLLTPGELADLPVRAKSPMPSLLRHSSAISRSCLPGRRNQPIRPYRPIVTTSRASVGKSQSTEPRCGMYATRLRTLSRLASKIAYAAGGNRNQTKHGLEQRALAGPVGTHYRGCPAGTNVEIDIPQNGRFVIGDGEIAHGDYCAILSGVRGNGVYPAHSVIPWSPVTMVSTS